LGLIPRIYPGACTTFEIRLSETGFFTAILRAARRLGKKFADEGLDACRTVFLNLPAIVLR
jgi:hypothetical protein